MKRYAWEGFGCLGEVRFTGMQCSALVPAETSPIWAQVAEKAATEEMTVGALLLDTDALARLDPELLLERWPLQQAQVMIEFCNRLRLQEEAEIQAVDRA